MGISITHRPHLFMPAGNPIIYRFSSDRLFDSDNPYYCYSYTSNLPSYNVYEITFLATPIENDTITINGDIYIFENGCWNKYNPLSVLLDSDYVNNLIDNINSNNDAINVYYALENNVEYTICDGTLVENTATTIYIIAQQSDVDLNISTSNPTNISVSLLCEPSDGTPRENYKILLFPYVEKDFRGKEIFEILPTLKSLPLPQDITDNSSEPNPEYEFEIRLESLLKSELSHELPDINASNIWANLDAIRKVKIKYAEAYGIPQQVSKLLADSGLEYFYVVNAFLPLYKSNIITTVDANCIETTAQPYVLEDYFEPADGEVKFLTLAPYHDFNPNLPAFLSCLVGDYQDAEIRQQYGDFIGDTGEFTPQNCEITSLDNQIISIPLHKYFETVDYNVNEGQCYNLLIKPLFTSLQFFPSPATPNNNDTATSLNNVVMNPTVGIAFGMWLNIKQLTSVSNPTPLIFQISNSSQDYVRFEYSGPNITLLVRRGVSTANVGVSYTPYINAWHHVAFKFKWISTAPSGIVAEIYIDGVLINPATYTVTNTYTVTPASYNAKVYMNIVRNVDATQRNFKICKFYLDFDYSTDITQLYNNSCEFYNDLNFSHHWEFNEGSGNTVVDFNSGNNLVLTPTFSGTAQWDTATLLPPCPEVQLTKRHKINIIETDCNEVCILFLNKFGVYDFIHGESDHDLTVKVKREDIELNITPTVANYKKLDRTTQQIINNSVRNISVSFKFGESQVDFVEDFATSTSIYIVWNVVYYDECEGDTTEQIAIPVNLTNSEISLIKADEDIKIMTCEFTFAQQNNDRYE